ncbi:unnamed protein product [Prunus armeniaca]
MFSASKLVTVWEWELMSTRAEIVSTAMTDLMVLMLMVQSQKEDTPVIYLPMKENYPLASAAPPLCAGITVYASMHIQERGSFSQLGADNFVVSSDRNQMKALVKSVDFIHGTIENWWSSGLGGIPQ